MAVSTTVREAIEAAWGKTQRDAAVGELAAALRRWDGIRKIYAHAEGWEKPPEVGGFIPDIFVQGRGYELALAIETRESLASERAREQVAALRAWEGAAAGRRFHLKVI